MSNKSVNSENLLRQLFEICEKETESSSDLNSINFIVSFSEFKINDFFYEDKPWTPLIMASTFNKPKILAILLNKKDVDVNLIPPSEISKKSALTYACRCKSFDCIDLLIEHNAEIRLEDLQQLLTHTRENDYIINEKETILLYFKTMLSKAINHKSIQMDIKKNHTLLNLCKKNLDLLSVIMNYYTFEEGSKAIDYKNLSKEEKTMVQSLFKALYIKSNLL